MTIDLTNQNDLDWMAEGRKRILRRIDRGEIDPSAPAPEHEWITPEYVAELRETYPVYADADAIEGEGDDREDREDRDP